MSPQHGFDQELRIDPNDEPSRGRVKVVALCECGETRSGFALLWITAWSRALGELRSHIEDKAWND